MGGFESEKARSPTVPPTSLSRARHARASPRPPESFRAAASKRPRVGDRKAGEPGERGRRVVWGVTVLQLYCTTYIHCRVFIRYNMYMNMKAAPYRSRRARRAAERPSTFSYSVAVSRQLAAVGRVILTWRARPARPSTRGALLLRDYARARPARPAHEREAALSGSRARPARPAHEREASLPPTAVTPEQGRQDRPMRGGASSPSSAPEQGRQGRRCEEWASV